MLRYLLILVIPALIFISVQADTIIPGGEVSGTWTQAGSPYIIQGNINVPNGSSLTINPGVLVQLNPGVSFWIWGQLTADGTTQPGVGDTIYFTHNGAAEWNELYMAGQTSSAAFTFCSFQFGTNFHAYDQPLTFNDCRFSIPLGFEPHYVHVNRCLFTVPLSWEGASGNWFEDCVFQGEVGLSSSPGNHFTSCQLLGDLHDSTPVGYLYVTDCWIQGSYTGDEYSADHIAYFTRCHLGGSMTDFAKAELHGSVVDGLIDVYRWSTSAWVKILDNSILQGSITDDGGNLTVSNSTILGDVHCIGVRDPSITGNLIQGRIYGSVSGMASSMIISDNIMPEGLIDLSCQPDGNGFQVTRNLIYSSPFSGIKMVVWNYNGGQLLIDHNTITGSTGNGIEIATSDIITIKVSNNIITSNLGYGLVSTGVGTTAATYNNVWDNGQGNYSGVTPGVGSISLVPSYVSPAVNEFRLAWGSPCIDSGDPLLTDPDGTRSDMGAYFFDQSKPVRVLLSPHNQPIQISQTGGSFDFDVRLTNILTAPQTASVWCSVTLPSGSAYGPVMGPVQATIPAGLTVSRLRTQAVPSSAPEGLYHYNGYAVVGADTSKDSFTFIKSGAAVETDGGWLNTGEEITAGLAYDAELLPSAFNLMRASPNPFNPTTAIRYQLSAVSQVSLRVYDVLGRWVTTLVEGMQEAGVHEVTFDGSKLSSGIYFVRMQAGDYRNVQKLVLMK